MKNVKEKINSILEYEKEIKEMRDFYFSNRNNENLRDIENLNIELKTIKTIKGLLNI